MAQGDRVAMIAGGVLLAVATALAAIGRIFSVEATVARALYDLPSWTTGLQRVLMQAGTRAAVAVAVIILLVAGHRRLGAVVGLAGAAAWVAARILKELVDRPRPSAGALARPLREVVEGNGFPSTHAAVATALVVAVILLVPIPRAAILALVAVAVATAVARVHLGVHWPLDVIGGAGIGVSAAGALASFVHRSGNPDTR